VPAASASTSPACGRRAPALAWGRISTPAQARATARLADGVVVAVAIVDALAAAGSAPPSAWSASSPPRSGRGGDRVPPTAWSRSTVGRSAIADCSRWRALIVDRAGPGSRSSCWDCSAPPAVARRAGAAEQVFVSHPDRTRGVWWGVSGGRAATALALAGPACSAPTGCGRIRCSSRRFVNVGREVIALLGATACTRCPPALER